MEFARTAADIESRLLVRTSQKFRDRCPEDCFKCERYFDWRQSSALVPRNPSFAGAAKKDGKIRLAERIAPPVTS